MISPESKQQLLPRDRQLSDDCESVGTNSACSVDLAEFAGFIVQKPGENLFWFPQSVPSGDSITLASSRLGRKLEEQTDWFDALRTAAIQIATAGRVLLTTPKSTTAPFLIRLGCLLEIPLLEFLEFPQKPTRTWILSVANATLDDRPGRYRCYFKPLDDITNQPQKRPSRDKVLLAVARYALVLSVRKNGNVFTGTKKRILQTPTPMTQLLINRSLTSSAIEHELIASGATPWWVYESNSRPVADRPKSIPKTTELEALPTMDRAQSFPTTHRARIIDLNDIDLDRYLVHCTRRRDGAWPNQSNDEFLDDLIFRAPRRSHGNLSSLCRILASDRILGSANLTRDSRDVVCFSNLPLNELVLNRVFRPHLSRWDFEPYGIAIDRELLKRMGASPVIYGDDSDWERLPPEARAFFQLSQSSQSEIDWTQEREWRIVGDLSLPEIPIDLAVVFVKTKPEAEIAASVSRWPVVLLG